jgi:hypothetical protein
MEDVHLAIRRVFAVFGGVEWREKRRGLQAFDGIRFGFCADNGSRGADKAGENEAGKSSVHG